ncbi:MAG: hypothetical protein AAB389_02795 [Patescibacteria group bacterium]
MADPKPEEIKLEPITPTKYPEELDRLAKEIQDMEKGKRKDFSPEFGAIQKPKEEKPVPTQELKEAPAPIEKRKRVYKKRAPKNAPFEEVTPEQEVAPLEEIIPEGEKKATAEKSAEPRELTPEAMEKDPDNYFVDDEETAERAAPSAKEPEEEIPMAEFRRVEGKASSKFKIEDALNDPKFVEFLASYPDAEKLDPASHEREIENRHEAFRAQEILGKQFIDFYQKEIGEKVGFNLDAGTQEKIATEIREEVIRNPELLIARAITMEDFERLRSNNERWEKQIEDLGGHDNREEVLKKVAEQESLLKKEKAHKELADFMEGVFHPASIPLFGRFLRKLMPEQELKWHSEIYGKPRSERENLFRAIDKKIEDMAGLKEELAKGKTKERFNALRQEVFQNFEPVKDFVASLPVKIAKKVASMTEGVTGGAAGLKKAAELKKYIEKVKNTEKSLGGDELLSEHAQQELAGRVSKLVENLVSKHVAETKIENKPLENLFAGIDGVLSKIDDPQERADIFVAVDEAVEKALKNLQTKTEAATPKERSSRAAKAILLKVVQQKLKGKFGPLTE